MRSSIDELVLSSMLFMFAIGLLLLAFNSEPCGEKNLFDFLRIVLIKFHTFLEPLHFLKYLEKHPTVMLTNFFLVGPYGPR